MRDIGWLGARAVHSSGRGRILDFDKHILRIRGILSGKGG
jgi:hypothetical protein